MEVWLNLMCHPVNNTNNLEQVKSEPADLEEDSTSDIAVPPLPPLKMAPDIVLKEEEDIALRFGADNSIVAIEVDQGGFYL